MASDEDVVHSLKSYCQKLPIPDRSESVREQWVLTTSCGIRCLATEWTDGAMNDLSREDGTGKAKLVRATVNVPVTFHQGTPVRVDPVLNKEVTCVKCLHDFLEEMAWHSD